MTAPEDNSPAAGSPRPGPASDPRLLRIGHAERDAVIDILGDAAADGRLDAEELEDRMSRAAAAKTYLDLDGLVDDLPVIPPSVTAGLAPHPAVTADHGSGYTRAPVPAALEEPLVVRGGVSNVRRTGRWEPPPLIRAEPAWANVTLDFLEVTHAPDRIEVEVVAGLGTTTLVVPAEWGVDVDGLKSVWGVVRNKANSVPEPGYPLITVTGNVGMSAFTARGPNRSERRKSERRS